MLVGYGSISFIDELNHHLKRAPHWQLGPWNLINTRCGHLKKILRRELQQREDKRLRIKLEPLVGPRDFATCYCTSRHRHVFAQKLSSPGQMDVVRKYFGIHRRSQVIVTSSLLLLHTLMSGYSCRNLSQNTLLASLSLSLVFTLLTSLKEAISKSGRHVVMVKTKNKTVADLLCNLHSEAPLH